MKTKRPDTNRQVTWNLQRCHKKSKNQLSFYLVKFWSTLNIEKSMADTPHIMIASYVNATQA